MKKELFALCILAIMLSGCSECQDLCDVNPDDLYSVESQALFGETGGEPWGSSASKTYKASTSKAGQRFGAVVATADITGDGKPDVITAHGTDGHLSTHGRVRVNDPNGTSEINVDLTRNDATIKDSYGYALAAGNFCPDLGAQVIIASAPSYNDIKGAFGIIYKKNKQYRTQTILSQPKTSDKYPMAGTQLAIGDVDGDGKNDLVFQSTPMGDGYAPQTPTVNVILDVCHQPTGNYNIAASVKGSSDESLFGSALYVVDLDGAGQKEIVIVDNLYTTPGSNVSPNGTIYFYKYHNGTLIESRSPIIGEQTEKYGASIEAVAFSDIDGDGDLDLIVGEPMVQKSGKREGRVRTYTNKGANTPFDASDVKWSAVGGSSNMRFGSSVTIADLNLDGVNDLIVGAPGYRATSSSDRAQGHVLVFMGTKDGSIFSKTPFWNYLSNVSTSLNDDFGRSIAVADFDGKGWKDLVIGAPGASSNASSLDEGRVDIFLQDKGHCYTANGCFVQEDQKCYIASEASKGNKCLVCDPTQNNFGVVALSCESTAGPCRNTTTCDPAVGCQVNNKPDGTSCGNDVCYSDNFYATYSCQAGECVEDKNDCGNYLCFVPNANGCPTSCTSDNDCIQGTSCINGTCTNNQAPTIQLPESFTVVQGETLEIAATVTDPENDKLTYNWSAGKAFLKNFTYVDGVGSYIAPGSTSAGTSYQLTLEVTDAAGNISQATTTITIVAADIKIQTPAEGVSTPNQSIIISGSTNTTGKVTVVYADTGAEICSASIYESQWYCQGTFTPGTYTIRVHQNKDKAIVSENRTFTITKPETPNQHPVIVLPTTEISAYLGDSFLIDASKSYDPDHDEISFQWECTGQLALDENTSSVLGVTIPKNYDVDIAEACTLTVTDSKGASTKATVIIYTMNPEENALPVILFDTTHLVHIGDKVTIDASNSFDPEGTELSFKWQTSAPITLSNYFDSITSFTVPDNISNSFSIQLSVTDGDNQTNHATIIYDVVGVSDAFVTLTTPKNNATVQNPVGFSGQSIGNSIVIVQNMDNNVEICRAIADNDGAWHCTATLDPNAYRVQAYLVDENYDRLAVSSEVKFQVTSGGSTLSIPTITQPITGDVISLRPTVAGKIDAETTGKVHVWQNADQEQPTFLCTAIVKPDSTWTCTASYDLKPATAYTLQASWESTSGSVSKMSKSVNVTTQNADVADIVILSPAEGAKMPSNYAIIIAGSAPATTAVDVYMKTSDGNDAHLCSAFVKEDNYWACYDINLSVGEYTIYADDASQEGIVPSNLVTFSVVTAETEPNTQYEETRGGSCSMTTAPTSSFGWLSLVAALTGLACLRRRRHA